MRFYRFEEEKKRREMVLRARKETRWRRDSFWDLGKAAGPGNYFRLVNAIPLKARAIRRRIGARAPALRRIRSSRINVVVGVLRAYLRHPYMRRHGGGAPRDFAGAIWAMPWECSHFEMPPPPPPPHEKASGFVVPRYCVGFPRDIQHVLHPLAEKTQFSLLRDIIFGLHFWCESNWWKEEKNK